MDFVFLSLFFFFLSLALFVSHASSAAPFSLLLLSPRRCWNLSTATGPATLSAIAAEDAASGMYHWSGKPRMTAVPRSSQKVSGAPILRKSTVR